MAEEDLAYALSIASDADALALSMHLDGGVEACRVAVPARAFA
jgi:hypothetical protein